MGTKETLINALVENPNLTLRLEVLQGLTKGKHLDQLHGYAQLAISKEPAEWTCKSCGSVEPVAQWDCANCTSGSRRHLHEEVQKLFKKTFLED